MVYVYAKLSKLNEYIRRELSVEQIKDTLVDLGMDIKGQTQDSDPELKIEITAEKTDLISVVGIARSIAYYLGFKKSVPRYIITPATKVIKVLPSAKESRPKTVAAIIRGITITPEVLEEMIVIQEKIHDSFGRGRKKGAIGIYPMDSFSFPVTFGAERPEDIVFRPLESAVDMNGKDILEYHPTGKKYAHLLKDVKLFPVFRDANSEVLSMPPVINSYKTGRVEDGHSELFIEVSGFNNHLLDILLKVLVTTFIEMGATAEAVRVEYEDDETYELSLNNFSDSIDLNFINKLIGINVSEAECMELLTKMMYGVSKIDNHMIHVEIPCFRSDVWHDVDIADDVARAYGYNNIVPRFPNISSIGNHLGLSQFKERVSQSLVQLGFLELYSYILTSTENQFEKMNKDMSKFPFIRIGDSTEEGINMCRISLLPDVLTSLNINRKHKYPQRVFENGFTIQVDDSKDTGAKNASRVCVAIADPKANYTDIKGVSDELMRLLDVNFTIESFSSNQFIEGRCANILVDGKVAGSIGELHPQILENFGLLVPVVVFELNLCRLWQLVK